MERPRVWSPQWSPAATFDPPGPDRQYYRGGPKSLSGIALRAFCLGGALFASTIAGITILFFTESPLWRLPFFFGALSTFHFLEFWTTAAYNTPSADISSFLLTANWPAYFIAHTSASIECLLTNLLFPNQTWAPFNLGRLFVVLGLVLVFVGQVVRSAAMIQCGESFNHIVQHSKKASHSLITTGVYSFFRHPSYFGFFWWAVGTQLVLGNVFCFLGYSIVMWKFFAGRIPGEETSLGRFFGEEYEAYRKRTKVWIPFIA